MAVNLIYDNITIRGITYNQYDSFKCYASYDGAATSEGGSSAASLTKGETYYIYAKAIGDSDNVTHPYAICISKSASSIKGWYKENVFPYNK